MISNRLRLARQARGLSLQQLAELMQGMHVPITKGTLSNYETGKIVPQEKVLDRLAMALSVTPEFFNEPEWNDFHAELYNLPDGISSVLLTHLLSHIEMELSQYLKVCDLLPDPRSSIIYKRTFVHLNEKDKIRSVCDEIRRIWNIGNGAIHSICSMLEEENWVLLPISDFVDVPAVSGVETSRNIRFLFYTPTPYVDEFRMLLLKELGRAYLECDKEETNEVLSYFAREILLPADIIRKQFGEKRIKILQDELLFAKQKFGVSQREIMNRLWELGIVSDELYGNFKLYVNQIGFIRRENRSSTLIGFQEEPQRFLQKRARASADGLLDSDIGLVYR